MNVQPCCYCYFFFYFSFLKTSLLLEVSHASPFKKIQGLFLFILFLLNFIFGYENYIAQNQNNKKSILREVFSYHHPFYFSSTLYVTMFITFWFIITVSLCKNSKNACRCVLGHAYIYTCTYFYFTYIMTLHVCVYAVLYITFPFNIYLENDT